MSNFAVLAQEFLAVDAAAERAAAVDPMAAASSPAKWSRSWRRKHAATCGGTSLASSACRG